MTGADRATTNISIDEIPLLRIGEVCSYTQLGKTTIYRLIASGVLPSIKIGHSRRVPLADLREFVQGLRQADLTGRPPS
jgi:excisionase family DNA binding protein